MRLIFMGSPQFAAQPLLSLEENNFDLALVFTQPDKPAGRGKLVAASPVKRLASQLGLKIRQPHDLKITEVQEEIKSIHPDAIVVAAYGLILPEAVLGIPPLGCVNVHPSLLPRHRGASPIPATLLSADEFTGVTIMLMDRGVDSGPVLTQAQIPVAQADNTDTLTDKLSRIASSVLMDTLIRWGNNTITPRPQDNSRASYSPRISKADGRINWGLPAGEISRRIRAFYPWPGSYTLWQDKRLQINQAVPVLRQKDEHPPGTVVDLAPLTGGKSACGVVTGDGVLNLCRVQLEGKREMAMSEFLSGQRRFIGSTLH